jgi:hypothetical protein
MNRGSRLAAAALTLLFLTSCAPSVTSGTVVGREYDDPDTWASMEPMRVLICQKGICTWYVTGYNTVTHHDGPHWRLHLRDDQHREGWVDIDEATYNRLTVGQNFHPSSTP